MRVIDNEETCSDNVQYPSRAWEGSQRCRVAESSLAQTRSLPSLLWIEGGRNSPGVNGIQVRQHDTRPNLSYSHSWPAWHSQDLPECTVYIRVKYLQQIAITPMNNVNDASGIEGTG